MSLLVFLMSDKHDRSIILIGEKGGEEARDNAYKLFAHLFKSGRRDIYFVIKKRSKDIGNLEDYKSNIILRNSLKHYIYAFRAKYIIMNDGYLDAYPEQKNILRYTYEPLLYLNHGIIRYKKIFFHASHYYGRILRFFVSLNSEVDISVNRMSSVAHAIKMETLDLTRQMIGSSTPVDRKSGLTKFAADLSEWAEGRVLTISQQQALLGQQRSALSLARGIGFPSSRVLATGLSRHDTLPQRGADQGSTAQPNIFLFLTWRDYWPQKVSADSVSTSPFFVLLESILDDPSFKEMVHEKNARVHVCLHQKMASYEQYFTHLADRNIMFERGADAIAHALRTSDLVITDYSSVALDFCLAGIPVIFFQPDRETYEAARGTYLDSQDGWVGPVVKTLSDLTNAVDHALSNDGRIEAARQTAKLIQEYPNFRNASETIKSAMDTLPPRITFICYNIFGIGGTVSSVTNLANELFERGYLVDIISLRRTSATPRLGLHPAIRITSLLDFSRGGSKGLKFYERLLKNVPSLLTNKQDDAYGGTSLLTDIRLALAIRRCTSEILIPTFPSLVKNSLLFRRRKTKIVVQEHKFFSAHSSAIQNLIKRYYSRVDAVLCLTREDTSEYQRETANTVFTVPNGVPANEGSRQSDEKIVVALGRLTDQKQFHMMVQAFSIALQSSPGWKLHIYGDGPVAGELQTLIDDMGLQESVYLKGATQQAAQVVAGSEICAVSSSYEGFGMVFIEAYAAGKPVITFDIERGPKEIVIDGVTGLKAEPFVVEDYAQKLILLMSSAELRAELGSNARKFFDENFDIKATCTRFEQAIQSLSD